MNGNTTRKENSMTEEHRNTPWEDAAEAFDRALEPGLTDSEREAYWEAFEVAKADMSRQSGRRSH